MGYLGFISPKKFDGLDFFLEGKRLGSRRSCKVFEVSALLDHRVDEVLAAIIRETRLERKRTESSDATDSDEVVHQKPCLLLAFSLCGKLFHS